MGAKTYETRLIAEINKIMSKKGDSISFQDKCEECVRVIYQLKMAFGKGIKHNDIPAIMSLQPKIPHDKIVSELNKWQTRPFTMTEAHSEFREILKEAVEDEVYNNPDIKRYITALVKKKVDKIVENCEKTKENA